MVTNLVITTTCGTTSGNKVGIMTKHGFQCMLKTCYAFWGWYQFFVGSGILNSQGCITGPCRMRLPQCREGPWHVLVKYTGTQDLIVLSWATLDTHWPTYVVLKAADTLNPNRLPGINNHHVNLTVKKCHILQSRYCITAINQMNMIGRGSQVNNLLSLWYFYGLVL